VPKRSRTSTSTLRSHAVKKKAARGRSSSSGAPLLSPRSRIGGPPQVSEQEEEDRWHDVSDEDEEPSLPRFHPRRPPGPQLLQGIIYSPLQLFQMFFSSSVVQSLVINTNKFGDISAFYVFLALIIYMGLVKVRNITDLWSKKKLYRFPFPSTVMSSKRFTAISTTLHRHPHSMSHGFTWIFFFYEGKSAFTSGKGLSYDLVQTLLDYSLLGHGYMVYMDNFYTSPKLFSDMLKNNTLACGTIRRISIRQGFPGSIRWYRQGKAAVCQMDGHKGGNNAKQGVWSTMSVPIPAPVKEYNRHMGGVDLSDWYKTLFFHFIDIAIVNSFILHQQLADINGQSALTQKAFRGALVVELTNTKTSTSEDSTPTAGPSKPAQDEMCMPAFFASDATGGRKKCENCKKEGRQTKTPIFCTKCGVLLCLVATRNCFKQWHDNS
uniref:PiggyBac transposable element-derived protein domain-containing protein n=1 Tax=Astyanax mexicanus TaxID=7994 RepID=A0A3B1JRR6_ASTMX